MVMKTKGLLIQRRVQYYEEDEKNSKFFLGMVKSNQEKSTIGILEKGSLKIENAKDIMSEIENFYSTLYTTKPTDTCESWIDELKQNTQIPQISDDNLRKLADELTHLQKSSSHAQRINRLETTVYQQSSILFFGLKYHNCYSKPTKNVSLQVRCQHRKSNPSYVLYPKKIETNSY